MAPPSGRLVLLKVSELSGFVRFVQPITAVFFPRVNTGGDQGVLNGFFSSWATADISKHLPFIYNLSSIAIYTYLPAFKQ